MSDTSSNRGNRAARKLLGIFDRILQLADEAKKARRELDRQTERERRLRVVPVPSGEDPEGGGE